MKPTVCSCACVCVCVGIAVKVQLTFVEEEAKRCVASGIQSCGPLQRFMPQQLGIHLKGEHCLGGVEACRVTRHSSRGSQ